MKNSNTSAAGPPSKARVGTSLNVTETTFKSKRGVFQKDLQHMMYGFGDDINPLPETMALVEDIVVEYVTDLQESCCSAPATNGDLAMERLKINHWLSVYQPHKVFRGAHKLSTEDAFRSDVNKAQDIASERGKLLTEDFLFLVRKDPLKFNRCTELLSLNEEIKRAKKIFDETLQNID